MSNESVVMGGGMVPNGKYTARALPETAKFGQAGTGIDQIAMTFVITDGPFKGTKLPWFGFLNENTKLRTMESLIHAGCTFPGEDFADLTGLGSKEVDVETEITEHPETGAPQCRVNWVNEPGSVFMKTEHDDDSRKALSKSLKADLTSLKKKLGLKKPTSTKDLPSKENSAAAK